MQQRRRDTLDNKLPNRVDKFVGRRLRARRKEQELSQEALADRLGVTFQQLQKYENGTNRISAGRLYELARELGTSISYFYDGAEELNAAYARGVAEDRAEYGRPDDTDAIDLLIEFRSISDPAERKAILATARKQAAASPKKKRRRD